MNNHLTPPPTPLAGPAGNVVNCSTAEGAISNEGNLTTQGGAMTLEAKSAPEIDFFFNSSSCKKHTRSINGSKAGVGVQ